MKKDRNKFKCKDNELKLRAITRLIEEYEYMLPVQFYLIAKNILNNGIQ